MDDRPPPLDLEPSANPASSLGERMLLPSPPDIRTVPLTLRVVPARQGVAWVKEGLAAFMSKPLAMAGLLALLMFAALVLVLVPLIGPVLLLGALPWVTVAFMLATQAVCNGQFPMPTLALLPWRTDRTRRIALLQLGFGYALASFIAMAISDAADGGAFEQLQEALAQGPEGAEQVAALLGEGRLAAGGLLRLLLALLVAIPFWHAPALVHWGGQSAMQALFSSTLAVWRNRGAFVVYAAVWMGLLVGFAMAVNLLGLLLGTPALLSVVMTPAGLLFATVFYASLWFTFLDNFSRRDGLSQAPR